MYTLKCSGKIGIFSQNFYNFTARKRILEQGNVFTPVYDSVHGGGESLFTGGGLCLGRVSVQLGLCPGGLCPGGLCLVGCLCRAVSVHRGLCPGGFLSRGVSLHMGLCPGGCLCQGDLHMVKSRQYASYWIAFLFILIWRAVAS